MNEDNIKRLNLRAEALIANATTVDALKIAVRCLALWISKRAIKEASPARPVIIKTLTPRQYKQEDISHLHCRKFLRQALNVVFVINRDDERKYRYLAIGTKEEIDLASYWYELLCDQFPVVCARWIKKKKIRKDYNGRVPPIKMQVEFYRELEEILISEWKRVETKILNKPSSSNALTYLKTLKRKNRALIRKVNTKTIKKSRPKRRRPYFCSCIKQILDQK